MPISIARTILSPGTARTGLSVRAGVVDDIEREDDAKGYEPEARLHELVQRLVADGDRRAQQAGLRARRTLGQMDPGHQRRELLTLTGSTRGTGECRAIGRRAQNGEAVSA
ncbi:hypothetical protein [Streptomyces vietnamensis]|uniref:hypothetical protein n=1 Tax=Streptomyces vietnamensis TaxID=362257 RepID=UPI0006971AAF|nr:hypothetical protein [Streptomyces vietnamensis]